MGAQETSRISVIKISVAVLICAAASWEILSRFSAIVQAQTAYEDGLYHQGTTRAGLLARLRESANEEH